jgi:hypothetical protein
MTYIHAFMSATRVDEKGEESDGYIDPKWSIFEFAESRNDAGTVLSIDADDEDLNDYILDVLRDHLGAYGSNGGSMFYGLDEKQDQYGNWWTYSISFISKSAHNWWQEIPYSPKLDTTENMEPVTDVKVWHEL